MSATVTFVANGGTGSMAAQVAAAPTALDSSTLTAPAGALGFGMWTTNADGTGTWYTNGAVYDFAADVTLYAQWNYLLTIDPNFTGGLPVEVAGFQHVGLPPYGSFPLDFVYAGHTFNGWNTKADGTGTAYANSAAFPYINGAATIYAQWSQVSALPATPPTSRYSDVRRYTETGRILDSGLSVADINTANPQAADITTGGTSGSAVASLVSVVGQAGKLVSIHFSGFTSSAPQTITLPESFVSATALVSAAWTTAGIAEPTVTGTDLTVPAIAAPITTDILIVGV